MLRWQEHIPLSRRLHSFDRRLRESRMFARPMVSKHHPIVAQIVPIRGCNLACTYCNEFDAVSAPVPLAEMLRRVDLLAALGTTIITVSGGEPMLQPDLDEIIPALRRDGAIATLITNGYLLTAARIQQLNRAGLDYLQISIDNVTPDETSKKSLKRHCRAGGRFLYICEDGLVHYCSQQRGRPAIPLVQYTAPTWSAKPPLGKHCAPFCTISCVHQTAMLDSFRENPRQVLSGMIAARRERAPGYRPPAVLGALTWMFLDGPMKRMVSRTAVRFLRAHR
jgi:hypothetical protein